MQFRNTRQNIHSKPYTAVRMRVWLAFLCLTVMMLSVPASTRAADWMFRRSYFSHELSPSMAARYPHPPSRSAYRTPYARGAGFAVRSGYRYNRIFLRSGNSSDVTYVRENWFGFRD